MVQRGMLDGLKVAEFAWAIAGPTVAKELALHGATVVRIESHKRPEINRVSAPYKDGIPGVDRSPSFSVINPNKYAMSLDLTKSKAREVAKKLVAWADIVTESMSPGSMARLGLDYESCRQIRPDIIYFSTCQMGQKGPYSALGGTGPMGSAYAGLSYLTGWPDRPPVVLSNAYTDFVSPPYLASAVLAVLDYRRRTGKGIYLDQSQIEAGVTFWGAGLLDYTVNGRIPSRVGNRDPNMSPHGAFPCLGNDRWVTIAVATEAEWRALCCAMGSPEWAVGSRFATLLGRKENEDELEPLIAEWTKDYSAEEVMTMLQDLGVAAGVVSNAQGLFEDAQLKHRGHFVPLEHKVIGVHHYHAPPYRLSKTPAQLRRAAPCLGQDNEFVYKEILGYSDEEVTQFLLDGIITTELDVPDILKPKRPR